MTLETFRQGIMIFERIKLRNPPDFTDKETEDIWYTLLKHLSDEAFMQAVNDLTRIPGAGFFPNPPQILEAANAGNILAALEAWGMVQIEMNRCCGLPDVLPEFSSPIICRVVAEMGGLDSMWNTRDRSFVWKDFERRYNEIVIFGKMITGGDIKELEGKDAN